MLWLALVGTDTTPEIMVGPKLDSFSFILGIISALAVIFIIWLFKIFIECIINESKKQSKNDHQKSAE